MTMRQTFGAMTIALGVFMAGPGTALDGPRLQIRQDFIQVLASGDAMLAAQSDFNAAKADGDRDRMERAAFDLLMASASASFWSAMLDESVTPRNTNAETDRKVSELRTLSGGVLERLLPIIVAGDFDALTARLDESAESVNSFGALTRGISGLPGLRDLA